MTLVMLNILEGEAMTINLVMTKKMVTSVVFGTAIPIMFSTMMEHGMHGLLAIIIPDLIVVRNGLQCFSITNILIPGGRA